MILKIYGTTDAENLIKILTNSGYDATLLGFNEEEPHKLVCMIRVKEE